MCFVEKPFDKYKRFFEKNEITTRRMRKELVDITEELIFCINPLVKIIGTRTTTKDQFIPMAKAFLFGKTANQLISCFRLILSSDYISSKTLLRSVFENVLLTGYIDSDEKAKKYLRNGKFEPKEVRDSLFNGKKLSDYRKYYSYLCDYTHPNIKGAKDGILLSSNPNLAFLAIPIFFDEFYSLECLLTEVWLFKLLYKYIIDTFRQDIAKLDAAFNDKLIKLNEEAEEVLTINNTLLGKLQDELSKENKK